MKRTYVAPTLEVELYQLDQAIASNCHIIVDSGPAIASHKACDYFIETDPFSLAPGGMGVMSRPHNVEFYDDGTCDCYYTGGDGKYWTS